MMTGAPESPVRGAELVTPLERLERPVVARYPSAAALERLLAHSGLDPRMLVGQPVRPEIMEVIVQRS
jgi:hypothetical protein